jgi:hypothetical protein
MTPPLEGGALGAPPQEPQTLSSSRLGAVQRVLVVGVPRSGTTWVGTVLARSAGASYLGEPDNHLRFAYALRAKLRAGERQYPVLAPDQEDGRVDELRVLWENAFSEERRRGIAELRGRSANRLVELAGGRPIMRLLAGSRSSPLLRMAVALARPERPKASAASVVVKSVYASLCAEWVQERQGPWVVAVIRHPRNVISSWVELGWMNPAGPDPIETAFPPVIAEDLAALYQAPVQATSRLARSTWLVAALTCALEDACRRNPHWVRVEHEELCVQPLEGFMAMAAAAGLPWSEVGDERLEETNRPGEGYEPSRISSEMPDAWRRRLTDDQVREVDEVLARFPLGAAP